MKMHSQSMKVSSALRRIANARGRSRQEWRAAHELNNAAYAAERDSATRAPRLRKADPRAERKEFRAIPLTELLQAQPAMDRPHSVTLPVRDRIIADAADAGAAFWQACQRG
jgi:hypothetical protein